MAFNYYDYSSENGVITPDTSTLKAEVEAEFKQIFGNDIDLSSASPLGRFCAYETECRRKVIENNAAMVNTLNPRKTYGIYKDILGSLFDNQRLGGTASTVYAQLGGAAGTVIPSGALAMDKSGNYWRSQSDITIAENGAAAGYFICKKIGPVACPAGALNQIITPVLGWETINNEEAGDIGQDRQSDADFNIENIYHGKALMQSILSKLKSVNGFKSVWGFDNYGDTPQTVAGVTAAAKTVYVCVDGGTDADVAQCIFESKSAGAGYTGDVLVEVYEPVSGTYTPVKFNRPQSVAVYASIKVSAASDGDDEIKNIIAQYIEGTDIHETITIFALSNYIKENLPNVEILDLQIGLSAGALGYEAVELNGNQRADISLENITITRV